jgi:hypothetical protein
VPGAIDVWRRVLLFLGGVCVAFAALIWYGLVRPREQRLAYGTILSKSHAAAGEYTRLRTGPRREVWSTEKIPLPESYVFEIRLDDGTQVQYRLSAGQAEFDIGQKVKVLLEQRSIPLVWKRMYVREIAAANR